jgi:hypothetical protein
MRSAWTGSRRAPCYLIWLLCGGGSPMKNFIESTAAGVSLALVPSARRESAR